MTVSEETRSSLMDHANSLGTIDLSGDREEALSTVSHMLRLVVAAPEYQFG